MYSGQSLCALAFRMSGPRNGGEAPPPPPASLDARLALIAASLLSRDAADEDDADEALPRALRTSTLAMLRRCASHLPDAALDANRRDGARLQRGLLDILSDGGEAAPIVGDIAARIRARGLRVVDGLGGGVPAPPATTASAPADTVSAPTTPSDVYEEID